MVLSFLSLLCLGGLSVLSFYSPSSSPSFLAYLGLLYLLFFSFTSPFSSLFSLGSLFFWFLYLLSLLRALLASWLSAYCTLSTCPFNSTSPMAKALSRLSWLSNLRKQTPLLFPSLSVNSLTLVAFTLAFSSTKAYTSSEVLSKSNWLTLISNTTSPTTS